MTEENTSNILSWVSIFRCNTNSRSGGVTTKWERFCKSWKIFVSEGCVFMALKVIIVFLFQWFPYFQDWKITNNLFWVFRNSLTSTMMLENVTWFIASFYPYLLTFYLFWSQSSYLTLFRRRGWHTNRLRNIWLITFWIIWKVTTNKIRFRHLAKSFAITF